MRLIALMAVAATFHAKYLDTFVARTASNVQELPPGYNDENRRLFQADLTTDVTAADTIDVTLPANLRAVGVQVLGAFFEKWTTSSAIGARTKTRIPVVVTSYVEATGVVTLTTSTVNLSIATESGRVFLEVCPYK